MCFIQTGRSYVVSLFLVCGVARLLPRISVSEADIRLRQQPAGLPGAAAYQEAGDCMRDPVEKEFRRKTQHG